MKSKTPLVSVVLPTYNRAELLPRSVESVLNQTYKNFELIIIDDGSTDNTKEVVQEYAKKDKRVIYLRHKRNKGGSAARNTGIRKARGEYIAFLDDDDEWLPKKIEKQLLEIKKRGKNWGGVYCWYRVVNTDNGITLTKKSKKEGNLTKDLLLLTSGIGAMGSSLLLRSSVFEEIGYFDENFQRHQDIEFLIRFFRKFKLAVTKEILLDVYGHNYPNPDKMAEIKKQFFKKFKKDIKQFSPKDISSIYAIHNLEIARLYAQDKNLKKSLKFLKISLKNGLLSPIYYIKFFLYLLMNLL